MDGPQAFRFVLFLLVLATVATACGTSSKHTSEQVDSMPVLRTPHFKIGDVATYQGAYDACNDGFTPEAECECIAERISQRRDAGELDYPTLLDYNNPDPPGWLVVLTGECVPNP